MRSEVEAQRAILDYLHLRKIYCWRSNNIPVPTKDGKFRRFAGVRGMADIIGVLPGGRLLAIEVKSDKGQPSPEQEAFGQAVNEAGGLWFIARSVEDVMEVLK